MPPHCDTLDGPVVKAAVRALEAMDVSLVLQVWAHKLHECESAPRKADHHTG